MIASLTALLVAQIGSASDPRRIYAAGEKEAVFMLPPEAVCGSDVKEMVWTADGSDLIVRRVVTSATPTDVTTMLTGKSPSSADAARLAPKLELLVWSPRSHKTRVLASGDAASLSVEQLEPMPGTDRLVLFTSERTVDQNGAAKSIGAVSLLATGTGTITRLATFDERTYVGFRLSSSRPLGVLTEDDPVRKTRTVRFFGPEGRPGTAIPLSQRGRVDFDEAGLPALFLGSDREGKKVTYHYQKVDLATGRPGATFDRSSLFREPSPAVSTLEAAPVTGTADGARAPSVLLKVLNGKPEESGVVTTDGVDPLLSPKNDAVAYVSQGGAMVRLLAKVPRQAYEAALIAAKKAAAISNAKQVALGLIMFSLDMDDAFPNPGDYAKVYPYLKDRSIMDSFTYTFGGGKQAEIESPAETQIGYVSAPGGRAVAYADGHVRWIPDAP